MSASNQTGHMWGGRFTEATDQFVAEFTASIAFDMRLALYDIQGSKAHATMLAKVGVLTDAESQLIIQGLDEIAVSIQAGEFIPSIALEDVHMNIEQALTEKIGSVGKKLHTGRSRNDQVATDIRLYLRAQLDQILATMTQLQLGLLDLAESHAETIMPGFTHLQAAQPVTFGHHVMAWYEMIERDYQRLLQCRTRVNVLPLGAAALAGTTFPIDRAYVADLLGFDSLAVNSLDAVSDRDFAIEFCADASLVMMHLSRIAEELVLWTSPQFEFIQLPDRYCTGSSIMPQKKNPDVPELVRGKSARVLGHTVSLLMLMKAQPLAYNKDNQEDKEPVFDTVDTIKQSLMAYADMLPNVQVNVDRMRDAALAGFSTATDLADYLVRKGLPFRDAHEVVGQAVQYCVAHQLNLESLPLSQLQSFSDVIMDDVFDVLTLEGSVRARDHVGGTAPSQVRIQISQHRQRLQARTVAV